METHFDMYPVDSSNLAAIGYDEKKLTLRVQFHTGAVYDYTGVSKAQYDALASSESKGQYLNLAIKPQFACTKVA